MKNQRLLIALLAGAALPASPAPARKAVYHGLRRATKGNVAKRAADLFFDDDLVFALAQRS